MVERKKILAIIIDMLLIFLLSYLVYIKNDLLNNINNKIYFMVYSCCITGAFKVVSFTAGGLFTFIIVLLFFYYEKKFYYKIDYNGPSVLLVFSLVVSMIITFILKILTKSYRPGEMATYNYTLTGLILHADTFSFPSGHTARAFVVALSARRIDRKISVLLLIWATLVGLSRLVLGRHWFFDIIGGIVVAHFSVLVSELAIEKYSDYIRRLLNLLKL